MVDLVGIWSRIRGSVFNVNAQKGIRDGQKARMRERGLLKADDGDGGAERADSESRSQSNGDGGDGRGLGFG